jgi:hypothetical protein
MAVIFEVDVLLVVTLCNVLVRYQRFGGPCCLHLQGKHLIEMSSIIYIHFTLNY